MEDLQADNNYTDDFDIIENEDGSADIIEPEESPDESNPEEFYTENLAKKLSAERRAEITLEYIRLIGRDKSAREKHDEQCKKALESTGLTGDAVPAFSGGSTLIHPILAKISVDFASHAIKEIFPAEGPVRTSILGKATRKKMEKAERKRRHMNWQLTRQMPEYRANLEKMLPMLGLCGSQYIRMYWWDKGRRPRSEYISADKIYLPYTVSSFYTAQRLTYEETISDMEYDMRVLSGMYEEFESVDVSGGNGIIEDDSKTAQQIDKIEGKSSDDEESDEKRIVYNVYCYMKLPEDDQVDDKVGYAPYIMSINKLTQEMVALYRNWEHTDPTYEAMDWIIEWPMIPWGHSVYTIGAGHLVGQLARAASGALRCLLDSGLANTAPTALKTKSMGLSGQAPPIQLGAINEIRTNAGLDDIRKAVAPLPFNAPSNVLLELLGLLVNSASEVARSTVDEVADQTTNTPVGTQLSRIEQGLIVFSAIHARLHEAQRRTLAVLHRLNRMYMPDDVSDPETDAANQHSENEPLAYKQDYEGDMDVMPVSDPNIFSEQQRFSQNTAILQLATQFPQLYDLKAVNKRVLSSMKIQGIDELIPDEADTQDENPAAENMKMGLGQPAKALPEQDHLAHLQTHLDFWQSPAYGQNPAIQSALAPNLLAHLKEHLLFYYGQLMQDHLREAVAPEYTGDMEELIGEDGEAMDELSKAIAALSPMVVEQGAQAFAKALPIISQLSEMVAKMQPPAPMDPTQAVIMGEKLRAETEEKKLQAKMQGEQQQGQLKAADSQQKVQLDQAKMQAEQEKAQMQIAAAIQTKQMEVEAKDRATQASMQQNIQDNVTALEIAGMRDSDGRGTGNLKDGGSLGRNP